MAGPFYYADQHSMHTMHIICMSIFIIMKSKQHLNYTALRHIIEIEKE